MSIEKDIMLFNAFHQAESSNVLKMAQALYQRTNRWRDETGKPKQRYWRMLIAGGCKYSLNTLKSRWLTMDNMPELLQYKELPIAFSIYRDIANTSRKLGVVTCRVLKFKAEKYLWSQDRFYKELRQALNKKPDKHLCVCPICHTKHRPISKQKEPISTDPYAYGLKLTQLDEYRKDRERIGVLTNIEA